MDINGEILTELHEQNEKQLEIVRGLESEIEAMKANR